MHEVLATPEVDLYDAIEAGVPTYMVDVIAAATGEPAADVMEFIGVSQTTLRRKVDAKEPLPDVAATGSWPSCGLRPPCGGC